MQSLFREIRHNPLLWLLVVVPIVLVAEKAAPEAHTILFVLAVLAIVPLNALFMLGASFLLDGLRYHVQEYNRAGGRLYSALLLMATVALLAPSAVADLDLTHGEVLTQKLSTGLAVLLMIAYGLGRSRSTPTRNFLRARSMARRRRTGRSALRSARFSSSLCWSRLRARSLWNPCRRRRKHLG
jgi:Ca2+/H+ antiporter